MSFLLKLPRSAAGMCVLVLLAGCGVLTPPDPDRPTHSALVYGTVTGPDGAPVAGARVAVTADRRGACPASGAQYLDLTANTALTDVAGAYRARADVFLDVQRGCVRVEVAPPASAPLAASSVSAGPVQFGAYVGSDSVRVDVTLPAR
jgi:hypothetical protein